MLLMQLIWHSWWGEAMCLPAKFFIPRLSSSTSCSLSRSRELRGSAFSEDLSDKPYKLHA